MPHSNSLQHFKNKRKIWLKTSNQWNTLYYVVGVLSVVLSALSAAGDLISPLRTSFSIGATLCFALIGFLKPETRKLKNLRAYLILDQAIFMFEDGLLELKELHEALRVAESILHSEEGATMTTPSKLGN